MSAGATHKAWSEANRERRREYHAEWRARNREAVNRKARESNSRNRDRRREYQRERRQRQWQMLDDFKREQGCVDCGTSDGRLEFDHRVKETKSYNVSRMLGYADDSIWAEVAKCDVRCGTCHRHRHNPPSAQ